MRSQHFPASVPDLEAVIAQSRGPAGIVKHHGLTAGRRLGLQVGVQRHLHAQRRLIARGTRRLRQGIAMLQPVRPVHIPLGDRHGGRRGVGRRLQVVRDFQSFGLRHGLPMPRPPLRLAVARALQTQPQLPTRLRGSRCLRFDRRRFAAAQGQALRGERGPHRLIRVVGDVVRPVRLAAGRRHRLHAVTRGVDRCRQRLVLPAVPQVVDRGAAPQAGGCAGGRRQGGLGDRHAQCMQRAQHRGESNVHGRSGCGGPHDLAPKRNAIDEISVPFRAAQRRAPSGDPSRW
jgi:hypothetical protein